MWCQKKTFFVRVMERLYKLRQIDLLVEMCCLYDEHDDYQLIDDNHIDQFQELINAINYIAKDLENEFEERSQIELPQEEEENKAEEDESRRQEEEEKLDGHPSDYSKLEDQQMSKARTIYIYPSKTLLDTAVQNLEPLSGILVESQAAESLQLYCIYREHNRAAFNWVHVTFADEEGLSGAGLWYAPINIHEPVNGCPQSLTNIQSLSKMAVIAVPLSFVIGRNEPDASK